jgi:hydroxymethylbilane synthase
VSLRLASRRSPLALAQARIVQSRLETLGHSSVIVEIETTGDRRSDEDLATIGGLGLFALEVQRAVLDNEADVAVHSAKDLPSLSPEGLSLVSVPERRDPADVLVGRSLAGLGPGATVATGSPRRRALLLERRPDLNVVSLRGNMATRLAAVGHNGVDAVLAAAAALDRLGWNDRISQRLDPDWFIPQVGQGALALEARENDTETTALLELIGESDALCALQCERAFLRELGAGCTLPVAAYATLDGSTFTIHALMARADGSQIVRHRASGTEPELLGTTVARVLRDEMGGAALVSA